MKIKYLSISTLLVSVFIFLSCEKTANHIDYPDYRPKLVLHSFISPSDTILIVNVSTTTNVFGKPTDYPKLLPVKVNLMDGEKSVPFGDRDSSGNCSLKYTVEAGKEYKIFAQCPGYPDASGTCKVPESRNFDISIDTFTIIDYYAGEPNYNNKIRVKFTDIPNEVNYYNISEVVRQIIVGYDSMIWKQSFLLYLDGQKNYQLLDKTYLLSDHLMDGQVILTTFSGSTFNINFPYIKSLELDTYVLATDADYYKYHTSLSKYSSCDDPFTEFSPVYSNIKGGYGIFCSYMKYQKTLKIK